MKKQRRFTDNFKSFICISVNLLVSISLLSIVSMAQADDFPSKPINIMIPMAAGGGHDSIVRAIAPTLEKILKTPIVISYKTGGGGTIGWTWLSREATDGYTMGTYSYSLLLQQYSKVGGINIDKFDFISNVAFSEGVLSVRSDSPYKTFKDVVDYAKKNPELITVSNSGAGGLWHLLAAGVEHKAGIKFTHVPMTGGMAATMGMLGGHVTMSANTISEVDKFKQAGRARVLGVASETRSPALPDVPTFKEQGIDFTWGTLIGFLAPKGIPANRLQILNNAFEEGFKSAQFQDLMDKLGHRKVFYNDKELSEVIRKEDVKCLELLKFVGLAI